jgi:hypothetical protein
VRRFWPHHWEHPEAPDQSADYLFTIERTNNTRLAPESFGIWQVFLIFFGARAMDQHRERFVPFPADSKSWP